jgi:membrane protease YdiL (CAAX protease family)
VPALAGSGIAMALVREWRGSLLAPMVTHAVWNGSLMVLVRVALAP